LFIRELGSLAVFAEVNLRFIPFILAQNERRLAADFLLFLACLAETGGLRLLPCRLAARLPAAFKPPEGDLCFEVSLMRFLAIWMFYSSYSRTN
tara:strand:+ start:224 stop:505 length:282 start_codon:yes stop_codon:yes gene_type:complete